MAQLLGRPDLEFTNFCGIYTVAPEMMDLFTIIKRVARTDVSVLIRGQTGTGKELAASAIYKLSSRANQSFQAINCATLTPELLASELFGHMKGSFTGALKDKKGMFQAADNGTFFLDEIGEIPIDIQARLLRVLQEKVIIPLGSTTPIEVDVRIISATNKSLRHLVDEGRFREDLMYRVRVVPLFLPPLVERTGDVEALTWHFIEEENKKGFRKVEKIEKAAREALIEYGWPGNIRELRNNIEYAFAVGEGPHLRVSELTPELLGESPMDVPLSEKSAGELEKERILRALAESGHRKGKAAEKLGMSRSTLWRKLREYRILR